MTFNITDEESMERTRASKRLWAQRNKERLRINAAKWRRENLERCKINDAAKYQRRKAAKAAKLAKEQQQA